MKGATLFSGIGSPECAAPDIDWRWCAEIDPFASATHAAHFPHVRNLGDVRSIDPDAVEPVDLIVMGPPCQSFSVAGKRAGLRDHRGNLALIGLALAGRLRPRWLVVENVPGLLSSHQGRDFGTILGSLAEHGYGFAYGVLDAQWFGVPQRRRRVFVVGCLGDWRRAAEVLFERESLRGDPAPRREKREGIAGNLGASAERNRGLGNANEADSLIAYGGNNTAGAIEVATACNAHGGPHGRCDFETETFVAHPLGAKADGGWRGDLDNDTLIPQGYPAVAFTERTRRAGRNLETQDDLAYALTNPGSGGRTNSRQILAFNPNKATSPYDRTTIGAGEPFYPLQATERIPHIATPMAVRRLTPAECERLQGFPDGWTAIKWRGKPAADGLRYRSLGNAMAVPVIGWILNRIADAA